MFLPVLAWLVQTYVQSFQEFSSVAPRMAVAGFRFSAPPTGGGIAVFRNFLPLHPVWRWRILGALAPPTGGGIVAVCSCATSRSQSAAAAAHRPTREVWRARLCVSLRLSDRPGRTVRFSVIFLRVW